MTTPRTIATASLVASLALFAAATRASVEPAPSVYEAGSHYTATLHQRSSTWQLLPADGEDLTIQVDADCANDTSVPGGIWMLAHRSEGIVLRAPSATTLPAGHPGEVALIGCEEQRLGDRAPALRVPTRLIALLAEHSGAVYVGN